MTMTGFFPFLKRLNRRCDGLMGKTMPGVSSLDGEYLFFENGSPLLFHECKLKHIRDLGAGRCALRGNELFFSRLGNGRVLPFWPCIQACGKNSPVAAANQQFMAEKIRLPGQKDPLLMFKDAVAADNARPEITESREPHLLLFTHELAPGGAERQWCYLARELAERGYRTTLLTLTLEGTSGHYLPLLKDSGVAVHSIEDLRLPGVARPIQNPPENHEDVVKLAYAIQYFTPTHLLCQLDRPNLWGGTAALLADCDVQKILFSFRSVSPVHFPHLYEASMLPWYQILLNSKRLALSGNSRSGNADYASWLGVEPEHIRLIPNALSPVSVSGSDAGMNIRLALNIAPDAPVILGVFRLAEEKNPLLFLKVVQGLLRHYPELTALHAGEGLLDAQVRLWAKKMGISHALRFLGIRKDTLDLMRAADIFLLCSNHEGLPNVLLEAQRMELPIVATRTGGAPDAVREGGTALLAPVGDAQALTEHCLTLLGNPLLRRQMGAAGPAFVDATFTIARVGDQTLDALGLAKNAGNERINGQQAEKRSIHEFETNAQVLPPETVRDGILLSDLVPQRTLVEGLQHTRQPLLCLLAEDSIKELLADLPQNCLCVSTEPLPSVAATFRFDWQREENWRPLRERAGSCRAAFVLSAQTPSPRVRRKLKTIGISWILAPADGALYRLPTAAPNFFMRTKNILGSFFRR